MLWKDKMKIALIALLAGVLLAQPSSFESATVKPTVSDPSFSGEDGRNGVLKMWNVSLKRCIRYAYTIPEEQILEGPKWIDELRYDILARADHPAGEPELLRMVQPLLADRFKLQVHRETRTIPGYALVVAKGGIKAMPADPAQHSAGNGGRGFIDAVASPLSGLTIRLTALLGRPVIDMTGDTRNFTFHLKWTPDEALPAGEYPSLTTALQEQLGLKLESRRVSAEVMVVDRAELPSDN